MRRIFKWLGIGLGSLLAIALLAVVSAMMMTKRAIARAWEVSPIPLAIPTDLALLEEGKRLYLARGCAECHGEDLGGRIAIDDPGLGAYWGTNLTKGKGGIGNTYTDVDWVRAIRHGIKPNGTPVLLMPSDEFYRLSDHDLGAIVAYAKSAAPVDREAVPQKVGPLAQVLAAAGIFSLISAEKIDHRASRPESPQPGETVAYGGYLASVQCVGCHGDGLGGGPLPGAPPSVPVPTNLTPHEATGLAKWKQEDFVRLMRTGKRPDGSDVNPFMPWGVYKNLNDTEVNALWAYLRSVPAKEFGTR